MKSRKAMAVLLALGMTAGAAPAALAEDGYYEGEWSDSETAEEGMDVEIDASFDPVTYENAVTFEEMREQLGAVPVSGKDCRIACNVRSQNSQYWTAFREGVQDMAAFQNDMGLTNFVLDDRSAANETDTVGQLAALEQQIEDAADVVLFSPLAGSDFAEGMEAAANVGVPVIAVHEVFAGAEIFVGPNPYKSGRMAGEWANDHIGSGTAVIIEGAAGSAVSDHLTSGIQDKLAELYSGIEVVDEKNADWDRATAKSLCEKLLAAHEDLRIVFCNSDDMALGAVEAVKEAGLVPGEDVYVIGVDGTDEAYASIKNGDLSATVARFPYYEGMMADEIAARMILGQTLPKVIWTPSVVVDEDNVEYYESDLIAWTDPVFED